MQKYFQTDQEKKEESTRVLKSNENVHGLKITKPGAILNNLFKGPLIYVRLKQADPDWIFNLGANYFRHTY